MLLKAGFQQSAFFVLLKFVVPARRDIFVVGLKLAPLNIFLQNIETKLQLFINNIKSR